MNALKSLSSLLLLAALAFTGCGDPGKTGVTISPTDVTTEAGDQVTFTATVTGLSSDGVVWHAERGQIDSHGVYTAPSDPGTDHVVASSVIDFHYSAAATVTVTRRGSVVVSPATATLGTTEKMTFSATVTDEPKSDVTWSVSEGASGGSVSATGEYTAPATAGTYHVVATSVSNPLRTGKATVTVSDVVAHITPAEVTLDQGAITTFTSTVDGANNTGVTYAVQESDGGSVNADGSYTAPNHAGTFHVVATSAANPASTAVATVTVRALDLAMAAHPDTVDQGGTVQLTATATGSVDTAIVWTATCGSVDANGLFTAPFAAGPCTVTATSHADATRSLDAAITVNAVQIAVSPATITLDQAEGATFTAAVTGTVNTNVTWTTSCGSILPVSGAYVAPTAAGPCTVTATSDSGGTTGTATVTVRPVVIVVDQANPTLDQGQAMTFTTTVSGTAAAISLTWSASGTACGSLDASTGSYTAGRAAGTCTVTATNAADSSASGSTTVTTRAVTVTVSTTTPTIRIDETAQLTAVVSGTVDHGVTWSVAGGAANGSVDDNGRYTPPQATGKYTVVATSTWDTSVSGSADVTVPAGTQLVYVDPQGTTWRAVRNAASTDTHLVLDIFGPTGSSGFGVGLTATVDGTIAAWSKVASGDAEYAENGAYDLGTTDQLFHAQLRGQNLVAGAFQKGTATNSVLYGATPALTVAIDLTNTTLPAGTPVPVSVTKAHELPISGTVTPVTVALGQLYVR